MWKERRAKEGVRDELEMCTEDEPGSNVATSGTESRVEKRAKSDSFSFSSRKERRAEGSSPNNQIDATSRASPVQTLNGH